LADMKNNVENLFKLGVELMVAQKYKEASKLFKKVTEMDPTNPEAWHNLGIMRGIFEDYKGAIQSLRNAIAINPEREDSWYILGVSLDKAGDYPAAIDAFRKVVASDPKQADAWCGLGLAFMKFGDYKSAIDAFEKELNTNPDIEMKLEIEATLKETSAAREDEITRLTKAIKLFPKALEVKKSDLESVAKQLTKDISEGVFRNDVEIRALMKAQLELIQERLRELRKSEVM
jgi:tetratricopeptide (TPR) repeat protein